MDWRHSGEMLAAGEGINAELKNLIVWARDNGGMGAFYRSRHELIFAFKVGAACHVNSFELGQHGRYRTNVWQYRGVNSGGAARLEELAMHPTVKPVQMIADAIPFVFALYPEILLIEAAVIDPTTSEGAVIRYLPGYDGAVEWAALMWLLARMLGALYLLASALARFDQRALPLWACAVRLALAALLLAGDPLIHGAAIIGAAALVGAHYLGGRAAARA